MSENKHMDKDALAQQIKHLKQQRLNFNTYQTVFSEIDAMDYGPRYHERADLIINELYDRNQKIDGEIAKLEKQLEDESK